MNLEDYYKEVEHIAINEICHRVYEPGVKWKMYPNPMRDDDCWFLAEDKEINAYSRDLDGRPLYAATPDTPHKLGFGVSRMLGEKIINELNIEIPKRIMMQEKMYKEMWENPQKTQPGVVYE